MRNEAVQSSPENESAPSINRSRRKYSKEFKDDLPMSAYPDKTIGRLSLSDRRSSSSADSRHVFLRRSKTASRRSESGKEKSERNSIERDEESAGFRRQIVLVDKTPPRSSNHSSLTFSQKDILHELSEDLKSQPERPPSPMPRGDYQNFLERNKQMQIWKGWVDTSDGTNATKRSSRRSARVESGRI